MKSSGYMAGFLERLATGGAACHEGYRSCFFRRARDGSVEVVAERMFDPAEEKNE